MKPKKGAAPPPKAQSAEAADRVAEARDGKAPAKGPRALGSTEVPPDPKPTGKDAAKTPASDHDQLAEIRDGYRKIAKLEGQLLDLKATMQTRREALKTANRELRYLLAGQQAFPFGAPGKAEKLDTVDQNGAEWFEIREVGTNRLVATHRVGDPAITDFRKRPRDFIVRPLKEPPPGAQAPKAPAEKSSAKAPAGAGV